VFATIYLPSFADEGALFFVTLTSETRDMADFGFGIREFGGVNEISPFTRGIGWIFFLMICLRISWSESLFWAFVSDAKKNVKKHTNSMIMRDIVRFFFIL
jgi:hypothetical protein